MNISMTLLGKDKLSLRFSDDIDKTTWDIYMMMGKSKQPKPEVYVGRISKDDLKRVVKAS